MDLVNPKTNRKIKIGGATHLRLIQENILDKSTLDMNKVSIYKTSRQKMEKAKVEFYKNTTHLLNLKSISESLGCDVFDIIKYITNEFDEFKLCFRKGDIRIIFPCKELFIQEVINDYVELYVKEKKLDLNYWNQ